MKTQNTPLLDSSVLGKLCNKFDVSTNNQRLASDSKQKATKELIKALKKTETKSFAYNGYLYYLRSSYVMQYFDVTRFKKDHPDTYKEYLKQTNVKEQVIRRIDHV